MKDPVPHVVGGQETGAHDTPVKQVDAETAGYHSGRKHPKVTNPAVGADYPQLTKKNGKK